MVQPCEQTEVYHELKRKAAIVEELKALFKAQVEASRSLEEKAWGILRTTSTTIGFASGLSIALAKDTLMTWVAALFVVILLLYVYQLWAFRQVIKPREWFYVPGGEGGQLSPDVFDKRYIKQSEEEYLEQLLVDYVGERERDRGSRQEGAIQNAQKYNSIKASGVEKMVVSLWLIVVVFIVAAIAIIINV